MTATRRLAAILAADVAGYSRLMGADEGTLQALKAMRAELIDQTIAAHMAGWLRPQATVCSSSSVRSRPKKAAKISRKIVAGQQ